MTKKLIFCTLVFAIACIAVLSCARYHFRSNYRDVNSLIHETGYLSTKPFLKAHLKNGDVYILKNNWMVDSTSDILSGSGTKYDFNRNEIRNVVSDSTIKIPIDSVAIFETNQKILHPENERIAALTIMAGLDIVVGIICLTNPKACFGSCPTFYLNENDDFHHSDAEGFSQAIRPSTEYGDIDALNNEQLLNNTVSVTMKNEALETHCVRDVKLFAFPRENGERIYHTPEDGFYLCENNYPLSNAIGNEGDITTLLNIRDRKERYSLSDEKNLSSKEEIYLEFDHLMQTDSLGLILDFRQTLMTTYLIYSAFGYMGDEIGDIFAKMESSNETKEKVKSGIISELGKIDVYVWNAQTKDWQFESGFYEIGPIAINKQLMPLHNLSYSPAVKIKLVLNKGYWRIDYAALTNVRRKVVPVPISPDRILNKGNPDFKALHDIIDPDKLLISMPGSEYKFNFTLPEPQKDYELFLYSKGYYLEWMRSNWIKDKDLMKLWQMWNLPKTYLRDEAKNFKLYETTMEQEFWGSKIDTKTFVYHEN